MKNKTAKFWWLIFVPILVTVIVLGISKININNKLKFSNEKLTFENPDEELVSELKQNLIYSGGGLVDYYSPTLKAILKYDSDKYSIYESFSNNIHISQKNVNNLAELKAIVKIQQSKTVEELYKEYKQYIASIYDSSEISEVKEQEGIKYFDYSYVKEEMLSEVKLTVNGKYLIYENNDYLVSADVNTGATKIDWNSVIQNYADILKTISLDTTSYSENVTYSFESSPNISFKFDKVNWYISSSTQQSVSLSVVGEVENYATINISSVKSPVGQDKGKFEEYINIFLSYLKETYTNFKSEELNFDKQIGNNTWFESKYSYTNAGGKNVNMQELYLYDSQNQQELKVLITSYGDNTDELEKSANEIIETINIDKIEYMEIEDSEAIAFAEGSVLGASSIDVQKAAVVGQLAVEQIFNKTCVRMTVNSSTVFPRTSGRSEEFCSAGYGSGFFVNNEGYLITNAHVAAPNISDIIISSFFQGSSVNATAFEKDFLGDILDAVLYTYPELISYPDELANALEITLASVITEGEAKGYIVLGEPIITNYVQGNTIFSIDPNSVSLIDPNSHYQAELIDYNEIESNYALLLESAAMQTNVGISVPDLALLKINKDIDNRVVLKIKQESEVTTGSSIYVVGYPGAVNNNQIVSDSASIISTVSKGTVSAIKPSYAEQFNLIQIDASSSHGNSGGPIVDEDGYLVGVLTYGLGSDSADYNFGVSPNEVIKILDRNNISTSEGNVTTSLEKGLTYFQLNYFQWADKELATVSNTSPKALRVLNPIMQYIKEKSNTASDNTPIMDLGFVYIHKNDLITIFAVSGGVSFFLMILVIVTSKKKKVEYAQQNKPEMNNYNPMPFTNNQMQGQNIQQNNQFAQSQVMQNMQQVVPQQYNQQPVVQQSPVQNNQQIGVGGVQQNNALGGVPVQNNGSNMGNIGGQNQQ